MCVHLTHRHQVASPHESPSPRNLKPLFQLSKTFISDGEWREPIASIMDQVFSHVLESDDSKTPPGGREEALALILKLAAPKIY